jgi:hypothetical protein
MTDAHLSRTATALSNSSGLVDIVETAIHALD